MNDIVFAVLEEDNKDKQSPCSNKDLHELSYIYRTKYRLFRRRVSAFLKKKNKKLFTQILYITSDNLPKEYILAFKKQYPDKNIKVLQLIFGNEPKEKEIFKFEYILQKNEFTAKLYKYKESIDNIETYGLYSDSFSCLQNKADLYKIKNLAHITKCIRIASQKIETEIIHCENIPYYLGSDFEFDTKIKEPKMLVQSFSDILKYSFDNEPFWTAINLLDERGLKYFCKDKIIKKNLAALFGIKIKNKFQKMDYCLDYLFKNYEQYRLTYKPEINNNENILIERLNERTKKIFPVFNNKNEKNVNLAFSTIKKSDLVIVNSKIPENQDWINRYKNKILYIKTAITAFNNQEIIQTFNISNFREYRNANKFYLLKEFSKKRIETKFTDSRLFSESDVKINGYLDILFNSALLFVPITDFSSEEEIKITALSILKCFELRKNIQVIYSLPKNFRSEYFASFIEFLSSQKSITGKWLVLEGKINFNQFFAGSDMVILYDGSTFGMEKFLFNSLKYGCVPVTVSNSSCGNIVTDIFDNMNIGCGFKTNIESKNSLEGASKQFTEVLLKAIKLYTMNPSSWNLIIKNALNYDSSWNFDLIKQYNDMYESL